MNSCRAKRRLVCSSVPGLIRSFQFPGCSYLQLWAVSHVVGVEVLQVYFLLSCAGV